MTQHQKSCTGLLPCPFCGAELTINNANLGAHPRHSDCLFSQQVVVVDDASQVAKWNRRTLPAGVEPLGWIEHDEGGIAYSPYHEAARKLPQRVRFELYAPAQSPSMNLQTEHIHEGAAQKDNDGLFHLRHPLWP